MDFSVFFIVDELDSIVVWFVVVVKLVDSMVDLLGKMDNFFLNYLLVDKIIRLNILLDKL